MALTDEYLVLERQHWHNGGVQRIYRLPNGFGLSLVNADILHNYPFAWEAAVLTDVDAITGNFSGLTYDTPLTEDVEVFDSDEEANAFIARAVEWASQVSA